MQRRGERVRKECEMRRARAGKARQRWVRCRRLQVVVVCVDWGRKWVRLVFLFMALKPVVRRRAARLLPLQGIARGGGRVRNRVGRPSLRWVATAKDWKRSKSSRGCAGSRGMSSVQWSRPGVEG